MTMLGPSVRKQRKRAQNGKFQRFCGHVYLYSRTVWALIGAGAAVFAIIASGVGGAGTLTLCFFCFA
jgi:hypothetical protein